VVNDCGTGPLPLDEQDNDGDTYVECTITVWNGDGSVAGGDDCDDGDAAEYPGVSWYADTDGDGVGAGAVTGTCARAVGSDVTSSDDCSASDAYTYPGAAEICDGLVNDCGGGPLPLDEQDNDTDGYVECTWHPSGWNGDGGVVGGDDCDDGDVAEYPGVTWYADSDGDGKGDPTSSSACDQALASDVTDNTDCDDDDAWTYPGAPEICDGLVNDCGGGPLPLDEQDNDGDTYVECTFHASGWNGAGGLDDQDCDDGDAAEYPGVTWYDDADLDSYGDPAYPNACERDAATDVVDDQDCDDTDEDVNPDGVEICGDSVDNDCVGGDATCPGVEDLLITEIMQNPETEPDYSGEWIEIYNNSGGTLSLEGLVLRDGDSDLHLITAALSVPAEGYVVLANDTDATTDWDYIYDDFALGNGSDSVILATWGTDGTDGTVIHRIDYDDGTTFPADVEGYSMGLHPEEIDSGNEYLGSNWCLARSRYDGGDYGTPGLVNDRCWPEITSIDPTEGPEAGGTEVTVTGQGMDLADYVDFGVYAGTELTYVDVTQVKVKTPAGSSGSSVDVTVGEDEGGSTTLTNGFTYTD